jgi:hypothetical protein
MRHWTRSRLSRLEPVLEHRSREPDVPAEILLRQRWAWIVAVLLFGSFVVLSPFSDGRVVGLIISVVALALLLSRAMRQYVGIRVERWRFVRRS